MRDFKFYTLKEFEDIEDIEIINNEIDYIVNEI